MELSNKTLCYLEVRDYLFAIWNYYADKYNTVGIRHHLDINIFEAYTYHWKKHSTKYSRTDGSWSETRRGWMQQVLKIDTYLQRSNLGTVNSRLLQTFGIFIKALREFHYSINIYTGLCKKT